ncbi:hypothetical protein [Deefgea salmonis]|uniref:BioF2-like acetyltransferase domain-containing protein n=1 Tax=Deefgea salmonis TaxID=2875502 RepID=A0ABS8BLD1_9NEIS|nr:hypothetical protein [Deefgea salmonis]MCB5196411.1 hypothetical protein [Deefgea salmonis]
MSPLWIKHCAWFSKQRIRIASRHWSGSVLARQRASLDPSPDLLVNRFQELLNQVPRGRLGYDQVDLILGSPWVRYVCLPWQAGLNYERDWESYARLLLTQHYGVSSESWRIRIATGGYGQPRIAAAFDEGLYQTLLELCRTSKMKLGKIEPLFTTAVNQHQRQLKAAEYALLILEQGHALIGFYRHQTWQGIISLPIQLDHDSPENHTLSLAALVREAAVLSEQFLPEHIYLTSSEFTLPSVKSADFDFEWLGAVQPLFITGDASQ